MRLCCPLIVLALLAAGCGRDDGGGAPTPERVARQLEGKHLSRVLGTIEQATCKQEEGDSWHCEARTSSTEVACELAVTDGGAVKGTYCTRAEKH